MAKLENLLKKFWGSEWFPIRGMYVVAKDFDEKPELQKESIIHGILWPVYQGGCLWAAALSVYEILDKVF